MARERQLRQNTERQLRVLHRPPSPIDLSLDIFITAEEAERCTPRTIETCRFVLDRFSDWLGTQGIADARQIAPQHIRLFLAGLDKQGRAASYIHIHARVIKTWLRFLLAEELIPTDPMRKVAMPRLDKTILPAFTSDDVKHLLGACATDRDRAMVLCLLDTGCRAAELVGLNIGDVDTKGGAVTIRQGKGRKDRVAFLGAKARKVLMKYLMTRPEATEDAALFPSSKTGGALTPDGSSLCEATDVQSGPRRETVRHPADRVGA